MYSLATSRTMGQSWGQQFQNGGSNPTGMLCYFTGPVPATIADIPFDENNIYDIYSNMEGCLQYTSSKINDANGRVKFQAEQSHSYLATKQPLFEADLNKWSYVPKLQIIEGVWMDRRNGNFDILNGPTWWGNSFMDAHTYLIRNLSLNFANHGIQYLWHPYRVRDFGERNLSGYDFYNYWGLSSNRNAGNIHPLVLEFDESIAIDTLEYYRSWFPGNGNSVTSIDLSWWDETLLEGAGDWVFSETLTVVEAGANTPVEQVNLVYPLEAKIFKLSFGDTASSTLHLAWVRFLSTTSPTTPRPSIDITWGLIIPWEEGAKSFASYYEHNRTVPGGKVPLIEDGKITYKSQHHLPALLVDVGGPHSFGSTVNLTRAEGVVPGEVPELLNFVIEFFD